MLYRETVLANVIVTQPGSNEADEGKSSTHYYLFTHTIRLFREKNTNIYIVPSYYLPVVHTSETFVLHLFSSTETYSDCQQKHANSQPADPANWFDSIILTSSLRMDV